MKVICFGDSNTFGYDPRCLLGGRYDAENRWVDILAAETGWTVHDLGQNGQSIPVSSPIFPADTGLLILMLGTNDLLQGCTPQNAADKLEHFLTNILLPPYQILLIAPPPLSYGEWVSDPQLIQNSKAFANCCRITAEHLGIRFADAGKWNIPLTYDGVHFTQQGHKAFAAGLLEVLK